MDMSSRPVRPPMILNPSYKNIRFQWPIQRVDKLNCDVLPEADRRGAVAQRKLIWQPEITLTNTKNIFFLLEKGRERKGERKTLSVPHKRRKKKYFPVDLAENLTFAH